MLPPIVVNEINPSQEWVELYNLSSSDFSLQNCKLTLGGSGQEINFTEKDIVSPFSFKILEKGTGVWKNNWLNDSGDTVSLFCPAFSDSSSYGSSVKGGKSYARSPNGSGDFFVFESSTKGDANQGTAPTAAPVPTPTPTKITSPTTTPQTPTPTIETTTESDKVLDENQEVNPEIKKPEVVLSSKTQSPKTNSPSPSFEPQIKKKSQMPFFSFVLISLGVLFIIYSFYIMVRSGFPKKDR